MKKIKVFVASPSDIQEERDSVNLVVNDLNTTVGDLLDVTLETIRWETHGWSNIGEDAQDVINKEIGEYDVFVGIMWKRFGTITKRAASGTVEEFDIAYNYFKNYDKPKIMFYFKTKPFYSKTLEEIQQFEKVIKFRKELENFGVLFWEYYENLEFERNFRNHLTNQIKTLSKPTKPSSISKKKAQIFFSYKREDLGRVEPIYDMLKSNGFMPWIDVQDILPGKTWVKEIEKSIKNSDFFLTFISNNSIDKSIKSETGFGVNSEINIAVERYGNLKKPKKQKSLFPKHLPINSYIIPIRLDNVTPPKELLKYQWLDYFEPDGPKKLIYIINEIWNNN